MHLHAELRHVVSMTNSLRHRFVQVIPESIDEGLLYVSIDYRVAVHSCCCGCGKEVVTPIAPTDWRMIFDGETVSLDPSIGNWAFKCRSHYWIRKNRVQWANRWTEEEIDEGRNRDAERRKSYFDNVNQATTAGGLDTKIPDSTPEPRPQRTFWEFLFNWRR